MVTLHLYLILAACIALISLSFIFKKTRLLLKELLFFITSIINKRYIIFQLVKRDFINKYLGSFFGLAWAFVQPTVYILVIWAVFSFGLKAGNLASDHPFILWLMIGLIPWFFITETIISATRSILEYRYLIKKIVFKASIIPLIKIFSIFIVHLFLIIFLIIFCFFYRYFPAVIWVQIFYYIACLIIFLIGFSWLSSALMVFIKDIGHIVAISMQIFFWITPIFWDYTRVPENFRLLLYINPFYYIIQGYRDTFLYNTWFWQRMPETLFFWIVTIIIFTVGALTFKKLRPYFALAI